MHIKILYILDLWLYSSFNGEINTFIFVSNMLAVVGQVSAEQNWNG